MKKAQQSETGWQAWVNLMPGQNSTLHVTGIATAPNSCYKSASLVPDGSIVTPETISLRLEWVIEGTNCMMFTSPHPVYYTTTFIVGKTNVLIAFQNGSTINLPIEEAH